MHQTRQEQGNAAIEFVLIFPLLLVVLCIVIGFDRMAHARHLVEGSATDAARAASLERNTSLSTAAAVSAAHRSLDDGGLACQDLAIDVDISQYRPGGAVTVTLRCTAALGDVAIAGLPGHRVFEAHASVPIEKWRSA